MTGIKEIGLLATLVALSGCSGSDVENAKANNAPLFTAEKITVSKSYAALKLDTQDRSQFGGFSGLWLADDCSYMISFSDYSQVSFFSLDKKVKRSGWFQADLKFDQSDRLSGLNLTKQGQLVDIDGEILSGAAESIAWDSQGFLVSFDDKGDIYRYSGQKAEGQLLSQQPVIELEQKRLGEGNAGLEALTELSGDRLLALWEKADKATPLSVGQLISTETPPVSFNYTAYANPGAATTLDDGSVVIAERKYQGQEKGLRFRLTRIQPDKIKVNQTVLPELLLDHTSLQYDNFEGISYCKRNGRQWLFIMSDNNGDWPESWVEDKGRQRQKTLLLQLDLDDLLDSDSDTP